MMTVQAQQSVSNPGISSKPSEFDRPVDEYTPFISKDIIHALGSSGLISITILWDTGANQSLLLENRLSQLVVTCASTSTLIQGVELKTVSAPLHIVMLNCDITSGTIMV